MQIRAMLAIKVAGNETFEGMKGVEVKKNFFFFFGNALLRHQRDNQGGVVCASCAFCLMIFFFSFLVCRIILNIVSMYLKLLNGLIKEI